MYLVKKRLNSPEAALLLEELYVDNFCYKSDDITEKVFGVTIYRDNESISDFNMFEVYISDYLKLDIKKFFNMSLDEYISTTHHVKDILNKHALEEIKRLEEAYNSIEDNINDTSDDMNNMFNLEDMQYAR